MATYTRNSKNSPASLLKGDVLTFNSFTTAQDYELPSNVAKVEIQVRGARGANVGNWADSGSGGGGGGGASSLRQNDDVLLASSGGGGGGRYGNQGGAGGVFIGRYFVPVTNRVVTARTGMIGTSASSGYYALGGAPGGYGDNYGGNTPNTNGTAGGNGGNGYGGLTNGAYGLAGGGADVNQGIGGSGGYNPDLVIAPSITNGGWTSNGTVTLTVLATVDEQTRILSNIAPMGAQSSPHGLAQGQNLLITWNYKLVTPITVKKRVEL